MSSRRSSLLGGRPGWKSGPQAAPVEVEQDHPPPGEGIEVVGSIAGDMRAAVGRRAQMEHERLRERTRDVLGRTGAAFDDARLDQIVSDILGARESFSNAFEELLQAGRRLNRVQTVVGAGGYKALFEAGLFPFSEATASKMRRIAGAIDGELIPPDLLPLVPQNLSGAYLLASLPGEIIVPTMKALGARKLLPSAPYRALEKEVKRLRFGEGRVIADLEATLKEKVAARDRLNSEIAELEARIEAARGPHGSPEDERVA